MIQDANRNEQPDTAQINSLIAQAFQFRQEQQTDSCIVYAKKALDLIEGSDLSLARMRALRLIGSSYVLQDDYLTANLYLQQITSTGIPDDQPSQEELANAFNYKAIVISYLGNYDSALLHFNEAKLIYERVGNLAEAGGKVISIGKMNMHLGNYAIALQHFFDASDRIGDNQSNQSVLNLNIGQCYVFLEDPEKAIAYTKKALAGFEQIGTSVVGLYESHTTLGRAYSLAHIEDSSVAHFNRSITISETMDYPDGEAGGQYYLSLHHLRTGDWTKAYELAEIAFLHFSKVKGLSRTIDALKVLAEASLRLQNIAGGLNFAKEGLLLSRELKAKDSEKDFLKLLADLYAASGHYEVAYNYSSAFNAMKDIVLDEEKTREIANLEAIYETEKKEQELVVARSEQRAAEAKLEEQRVRELLLFAGLIAVALFLILGAILFYFQRKNKKKAQAQNIQLQQLNQTKDRFFTIVGHDLRGPITSFTGVNTLMDWYIERKDFKKLKELGTNIAQSAGQLDTLLNNLLGWAMAQTAGIPYSPEQVPLKALTEEVQLLFKHLLEAKQIVLTDNTPEDVTVFADKNALMLVLRNLISNALKFTPKGGFITISCRDDGHSIWVMVEDSGVGIDPKKIKGLFELNEEKSTFGTANEKGTGLGLLLCKEYVELNKGMIQVESLVGKGTTFSFSIPTEKENRSNISNSTNNNDHPKHLTSKRASIPINQDYGEYQNTGR